MPVQTDRRPVVLGEVDQFPAADFRPAEVGADDRFPGPAGGDSLQAERDSVSGVEQNANGFDALAHGGFSGPLNDCFRFPP